MATTHYRSCTICEATCGVAIDVEGDQVVSIRGDDADPFSRGYDRVFADVMIGFLFTGKDRARLVDKEDELAARMLGADTRYTGKPMREAHAKVPILGGHFDRALRSQVTADRDSHCDHEAAAARTTVDAPTADKPVGLGKR